MARSHAQSKGDDKLDAEVGYFGKGGDEIYLELTSDYMYLQ